MRRWAFHTFAALSLLLWIATIVLWVRGRTEADFFHWIRWGGKSDWQGQVNLTSASGCLVLDIAWSNRLFAPNSEPPKTMWRHGRRKLSAAWSPNFVFDRSWGGFGYRYGRTSGGATWPGMIFRNVLLGVPAWFLVLVFAAPPAWWIVLRRRERLRRMPGRCQQCGYDLRATPDRCPECGCAVPAPATMATAAPVPSGHLPA